jgi:hypothetical protein
LGKNNKISATKHSFYQKKNFGRFIYTSQQSEYIKVYLICDHLFIFKAFLASNFCSFDASDFGSWQVNGNFPSVGRKSYLMLQVKIYQVRRTGCCAEKN